MITPSFHLSQTDTQLVVTAICPAIISHDIEIHTHDTHFSLHIPPYFLRLDLPGPVIEDDSSSAKYDAPTGALVVSLTKLNPGDEFVGLNDMDKLLGAYKNKITSHLEEDKEEEMEISSALGGGADETREALLRERKVLLEAEANQWLLPQTLPSSSPSNPRPAPTAPSHPYGFFSSHSSLFLHGPSSSLAPELLQMGPQPESTTPEERLRLAEQAEDDRFDGGYYQADFAYDEEIGEVLRWEAPLTTELHTRMPEEETDENYFTEAEKEEIAGLPQREYPTSYSFSLALISLLLSTSYDTRQTLGDPTLESPWTLTALTPLFTSLVTPPPRWTLTDVVRSSYRRMLAFPLYRSWALAEKVRQDVADVLKGGRRSVARTLLGMRRVLLGGEGYDVWVKVWVGEMCGWVVSGGVSDNDLFALSSQVRSLPFTKAQTGWPLQELEDETMEGEGDEDVDLD